MTSTLSDVLKLNADNQTIEAAGVSATAVIDGRDFVTAEDVQSVAKDTLGHRVKLGQRARAQGMNMEMAIKTLLQTVKAPRT